MHAVNIVRNKWTLRVCMIPSGAFQGFCAGGRGCAGGGAGVVTLGDGDGDERDADGAVKPTLGPG